MKTKLAFSIRAGVCAALIMGASAFPLLAAEKNSPAKHERSTLHPGFPNSVTVRFGEQDSCKVTGVTTVGEKQIQFDLSKLPKKTKVRRALLRLWVPLYARAFMKRGLPKHSNSFSIKRWDDPKFDGFKVWQVGGGEEPLDTFYPFTHTGYGCHEWDVTAAVQSWVAKPASNKGLKTNFPLPPKDFKPAWQRPYLEITYAGKNPDRPKQPTNLKAFYRSGQVFLTWKQAPYKGAFFDSNYRVYMSSKPITAANLGQAALLGEVHKNSQLNYRRSQLICKPSVEKTKKLPLWEIQKKNNPPKGERRHRMNFVIDESWTKKPEVATALKSPPKEKDWRVHLGPQISDDTGLFVYTLRKSGAVYFAVTSLVEGNENLRDFSASNSLAQSVKGKVAEPRPILQGVSTSRGNKHQYREYVYWGGGQGRLHNEPSTPFYFVYEIPPRWLKGMDVSDVRNPKFPSWIISAAPTAGYSTDVWQGGLNRTSKLRTDGNYLPPTRLAPFPNAYFINRKLWPYYPLFYFGERRRTIEPKNLTIKRPWGNSFLESDNGYGYVTTLNTGRDPRQAIVRPYLENRRIFEIDFVLKTFPKANPDYVVPTGPMDNSALLFGLHHADRIAFICSAQESIWTPNNTHKQHLRFFFGQKTWKLKTDLGHDVWQWNDILWLAKHFPKKAWPFISHVQSPNFTEARGKELQKYWGDKGYPKLYLDLAKDKRGGNWWWCDIGDAPQGEYLRIPRNQAYLALYNVNFAEVPNPENWQKEPRGSLNGYLDWSRPMLPFRPRKGAKPSVLKPDLIDTPKRFEVSLRISDHGMSLNGQSVPPTRTKFGFTDITPWRLQKFKVEKGKKYLWQNKKVQTGQILQAGAIEPDERGLLTVPKFYVDKDPLGNKLVIEPLDGKTIPTVDKKQAVTAMLNVKTGETVKLPYGEYVKKCYNPTSYPEISKKTRIAFDEFARGDMRILNNVFETKPLWAALIDTNLIFPAKGRYRITAEAKARYGGAWPALSLNMGGAYGKMIGAQLIDTPDYASYSWIVTVEYPGKHALRFFVLGSSCTGRRKEESEKQKTSIRKVVVEPLDPKMKGSKTPYSLRIANPNRSIIAVGMPIQFHAEVLNAYGEPIEAPIAWSAGAGKIDNRGVFVAEKPGACAVTAKAGTLEVSTSVIAGEMFHEDFSNRHTKGWVEFLPDADFAKAPRPRTAADMYFMVVKVPFAYDPARPSPKHWGFHHHDGQLISRPSKYATNLVWEAGSQWKDYAFRCEISGNQLNSGVVFRYQDRGNYYAFLRERKTNTAKFLKRVNGKQQVLASVHKLPAAIKGSLDKVRVEAKGSTFQVYLNDSPVFPKPITDGDLKKGAIGFCTLARRYGVVAFDNVEVQPLK